MKGLLTEIKKKFPKVFELMQKEFSKRDGTYFNETGKLSFHDLELFFDENEIEIRSGKHNSEIIFNYGWGNWTSKITETRTEAKKQAILKACSILEDRL